ALAVRERTRVVRSANAAATSTAEAAAGESELSTPWPKAPSAPVAIARACTVPLAKTARSTPSQTRRAAEASGPARPARGATAKRDAAATTNANFFISVPRCAAQVVEILHGCRLRSGLALGARRVHRREALLLDRVGVHLGAQRGGGCRGRRTERVAKR